MAESGNETEEDRSMADLLENLAKGLDSLTKRFDGLEAKMGSVEQSLDTPAEEFAARLAERTGDRRETVLLRALSLYEAALEAKGRGDRLVILTRDYKFVREITGFGVNSRDENSTPGAVAG